MAPIKVTLLISAFSILIFANYAYADECEEIGPVQTHELALFSTMLTKIKSCATSDGKAAYQEAVAARAKLQERNDLLTKTCPSDDARLKYVQATLRNLTGPFWRVATSECEP